MSRKRGGALALLLMLATLVMALPVLAESPKLWVEPLTGMRFVKLDQACFKMGTPIKPFDLYSQTLIEAGYSGDFTDDERPAHRVCLSAYWLGQYEVRADEWAKVMAAAPPSDAGALPVAGVTWQDATAFARRLTEMSELSGGREVFRLPTEAEWEHACLAGQAEIVTFENDALSLAPTTILDKMWTRRQMNAKVFPVGSRSPNAWGFHDMRGNVAEWVQDAYAKDGYKKHLLYDPLVVAAHEQRVLRGGSYRTTPGQLRCAERMWSAQSETLPLIGFRLVRVARP